MKSRVIETAFYLLLLAIPFLVCLQMAGTPPHIDEVNHYGQVARFLSGDYSLDPVLTNIPAYHVAVALLALPFGSLSLDGVRALNALFSTGLLVTWYSTAKLLEHRRPKLLTVQMALLPILTPFFGLAYPDVAALLCISLALRSELRGSRTGPLLWAALGTAVRQSNIVWICFFWLIGVVRAGAGEGVRAALERSRIPTIVFVAILAAFGAFVVINDGVALGHKEMHPAFSFHTGNIYFFLFLTVFLLFPMALDRVEEMVRRVKSDRRVQGAALILLAGYPLTFASDNPLNRYLFHLRNRVLQLFSLNSSLEILFLFLCLIGLLFWAATPLARRRYILIFPFAALSVIPSWLIEQRYFLVPFALLLLVKEADRGATAIFGICYQLPFVLWIVWGIAAGRFFL